MGDIFLKVFNLSVSASWLILAVLAVRFLLKRRAPKWVLPLLWGVVALRLICPVSIESALSLLPSGETLSPETVHFAPSPAITSGVAIIDDAVNPVLQESFGVQGVQTASANPLDVAVFIASIVWLLGMLALLIYALVSTRQLRRRVEPAMLLRENIYESEFVSSPFVFGLVKPKIYLPLGMDEETAVHVLAHERAHLARRDHWWKVLGFALLAVYWFSPLVWLSYILFCRDIELACDEKVVRTMDAPQRADYSQSLLSCAVQGRRIAVCPLAFGEGNIKARVKNVLSGKRASRSAAVLALIVLAVLAICFLTEPEAESELKSPFNRNYRIAEVVYTAPEYDFDTMITRLPDSIELMGEPDAYVFRTTGALESDDVIYWKDDTWGLPRETKLRRIQAYLRTDEAGWVDGLSGEALLDENYAVWQFGIATAEHGLACEFFLLQQEDGSLYLATRVSGDASVRGLRWVFRLEETGTEGDSDALSQQDGMSGDEILLLQADLNCDGVNERAYYENIGGGDYRLYILGDEELYRAELSTAHVGWDSYFVYVDGDTKAILHYSPYEGQGFYSCTYELFDFSGGTRRVIAENHIEIDTNENGAGTWSGDAEAFADEVNALLDRSVLLISTLNGTFEVATGGGTQYRFSPPIEGGEKAAQDVGKTDAVTRESILAEAVSSLECSGWLWYTAGGRLYRWNGGAAETVCELPQNEAGEPVLAELSEIDGCAALSYHVGGATMGHSELLLFDENGERTARYIYGGMIAVSGGVAVSADFSPMPAQNNLSISHDGGESWEKLGDGDYCYGVSVKTDGEQTTYTATSIELRDGWAYTTGVYALDVELGTQAVTQNVRVSLATGKTEVLD